MRCLVMEDFGRMAVAEAADPKVTAGHVVIDVVATGICGSDLHGYTGENGRRKPGQVMGHESVGRIRALGDGVEGIEVGATVTFNPLVVPAAERPLYRGREQHAPGRSVIGVNPSVRAAFAEQVVVPAENVVPLPDSVPITWGALVEPLAVAVNVVRRVAVTAEDTVLVIGGGPIGQSCVLAAQHAGATSVYVSEPSASRRALCEQLGAVPLQPGEPVEEQVRALNGVPVTVAIDAVGITATIQDALRATVAGGRVGLVGMGAPVTELQTYEVSTLERTITGSFCYSDEVFRAAAAWVADGSTDFSALISEEVPLAEGPDAFARLAAGADIPGKVLVRLDR